MNHRGVAGQRARSAGDAAPVVPAPAVPEPTEAPAETIGIGPDSVLRFHALAIRQADDDPHLVIVGRVAVREFVEAPAVAADAIRLLDQGDTVSRVEQTLAATHSVDLDIMDLADAMIALGFVAEIDGHPIPERTPCRPDHLPRLRQRYAAWLFSAPCKLVFVALLAAATVTIWRLPGLLPRPGDFFWTSYAGFAVLVNTAMFAICVTCHEFSHLVAARSRGLPSRIEFGTRLHKLVVQTDVTAAWTVPRRARYRIYLAGIYWDMIVICVSLLLIAYANLPVLVDDLLGSLVLMVALSVAGQTQVFMRTDLYFVLLDLLRCRNLFNDGAAYAGYLMSRLRIVRRRADPSVELPARERRAVRIYAIALALGSTVALSVFVFFAVPILLEGFGIGVSAVWAGLHGAEPLAALDGAAFIVTEGTLLGLFFVTFHRSHPRVMEIATKPFRSRRK